MRSETDFPGDLRALEDQYELIREIGQGSVTGVYLARQRESDRLVAIKAIRGPYLDDVEALRRFAREARTAAELVHPNIVRTEVIEQIGDRAVAIIMEYIAGGTVRDRLREYGAFEAERTERVLRDVANALAYAHRRGIVHRDVKPENVFLEESTGRALLSDFGIARRIEGDVQITLLGGALGTPQYMSPEQIDGETVDARSDIYSLGVLGWELLTGRRPWAGENLYGVIYKQKHEQLPRITSLRPRVPANLLFAIEGALVKDRNQRWQSAEEFLEQLTYNPPPVLSQSYPSAAPVSAADEPTVRFRRPVADRFEDEAAEPAPAPLDESLGVERPAVDWERAPETEHLRRALGRRDEPHVARALAVLVALAVVGAALFVYLGGTPRTSRGGNSSVVRSSAGNVAMDSIRSDDSSGSPVLPAPSRPDSASGAAATAPPPVATATPPDDSASLRADSRSPPAEAAPQPTEPRAATPAGDRTHASLPPMPTPRCRTASTPDQRACLAAYVKAIDAPMELAYASLISEMRRAAGTTPGEPDPRAVVRLQTLQRAWAEARERICASRVEPESVPLWATPLAECYAEQAEARAGELRLALRPLRGLAR